MTEAREAVLFQIAAGGPTKGGKHRGGHDYFADWEQRLAGEGREAEARGARLYADWTFRAWRAESEDPEPPPPCECKVCSAAYEKGAAS